MPSTVHEALVHRGQDGRPGLRSRCRPADVAPAEVPASGVAARVARVALSTTVTLGGGLFAAELREQRLGDQAPGEGRREAAEQGAPEHASAAPEGSLDGAGPVRLRAGGHTGEGAGVVTSGALVFGHRRAQFAQRHAPLLRRQLREGLLMGLLDRIRRRGPHKVAVALERLLVCQFARGGVRRRGSVLPGPRFGPSTAAKETIQKSHIGDVPGSGCRVRSLEQHWWWRAGQEALDRRRRRRPPPRLADQPRYTRVAQR